MSIFITCTYINSQNNELFFKKNKKYIFIKIMSNFDKELNFQNLVLKGPLIKSKNIYIINKLNFITLWTKLEYMVVEEVFQNPNKA